MEFLYCLHYRDDEHQLIAQYCQSLNGGDAVPVPRSPVQIMVAIDHEQREELEAMIRYVHTERAKCIYCFLTHCLPKTLETHPKMLPCELAL